MQTIIQIAFLVLFPWLVIYGAKRNKILGFLSPVVICYGIGMILANIPGIKVDTDVSTEVFSIVVPLAIPLLLFSTSFMKWLKNSATTILSFGFCIVAVTICASIATMIFSDKLDEAWKAGGMMIGVYTGGTPNLTAIGIALNVEHEMFILLNAADVVISAIYFLFLLTIGQKVLLRFLPAYKKRNTDTQINKVVDAVISENGNFVSRLKNIVIPLLMGVIALALSVGVSFLLSGKITESIVIISVTTVAIAGSFYGKIRNLKGTFETGEYLLLIFCVAIGTVADFNELFNASSAIIMFVAFTVFGSIFIHFILAAIFKIDADTVIITSVAGIFGPAFIGPIAKILNNREIVVSGLTTGLVGYMVGTFLGLAVAHMLH